METYMTGIYSLEEATQWMQDNQAAYTDPSSTLKCIGIHINIIDKKCEVFCLDYRRIPSKNILNEWHYHVSCFSNHYLLPLIREKWTYDEHRDFTGIRPEFIYTPELAKEMSFAFVNVDEIAGMIGRNLAILIYPYLAELDQVAQSENEFLCKAVYYLQEMNYSEDDEPF